MARYCPCGQANCTSDFCGDQDPQLFWEDQD